MGSYVDLVVGGCFLVRNPLEYKLGLSFISLLRIEFLPFLNGYSGQSLQTHNLTSLAESHEQSKHLSFIAFNGVIFLVFAIIT
jgi:hypothetical protein